MMAEKCTNTSSPLWRWMKPKPLLALNHFTVPCSLLTALLFPVSRLRLSITKLSYLVPFRAPQQSLAVFGRTQKKAASVTLRPLSSTFQRRYKSIKRDKIVPQILAGAKPLFSLFLYPIGQQKTAQIRPSTADLALDGCKAP